MPATGSRTSSSVTSTSSTSGPWTRPRRRSLRSRKRSLREVLSRLSCPPERSGRSLRSLRSRRLRRFRRLPPSLSSLSRVLSRLPVLSRLSRLPAASSRPPRVRVFSRRWPSSLPCSAWRWSVRCSSAARRCSCAGRPRRCSVRPAAVAAGLRPGQCPGLRPARRLRRGGGCGCAAGGCGRCLQPKRRSRPRRSPVSAEAAGASAAGAAAGASAAGVVMTPSLPARRLRPRPRARGFSWAGASESAAGSAAGAAAGAADWETVPLSVAFSAARAGALLTGVPARWAEMAVTRSPFRIREPPEIPSWLARAWSWASLRPARPLLLAGAAVDDPAAEDDVSTAEDSSVVSVTKDPSPSTASRLGAGRDDLIWAAVQICSRDFGLAGWILASTAGYCIHLARSGR